MGQRWGRRTFVYLPVHVDSPTTGADDGFIVSISCSGALIRAALAVDVLEAVDVTVDGHVFQSLVVRVDRDGFAVEWCAALPDSVKAVWLKPADCLTTPPPSVVE